MRYLSICSGIEAASVAWHGLGWEPVAFSEIEPFPSAVLKHHYPSVPNLGDMTTLPERILSRELEAPDLLVGGPPCQAFSVAGLRRGLDDARGSLTLTYCEIADAIDHVRLADGRDPAIIVYENVPGLLSSKDNAFGCLLAGLAGESEALQAPRGKWRDAGVVVGPQRLAVWRVLDAQFFAVAQRRRRIFLVSVALRHPRAWAIAESIFPLSACLSWNPPSRGEARKIAASGVECGVELCGPLNARDYKDPGTDGMNRNSAKMVPVAFAQNTRDEVRLMNGDGSIVGALAAEPGMKQTCYVAQPVAFRDPCPTLTVKMQGSSGWAPANEDAHLVGVAQPVAFHPTQDPISSEDGTTHAMGCGSRQGTATVAVAIRTANTGANGHGIAVDVTHTLDQAQGQAVAQPVAIHPHVVGRSPTAGPQGKEWIDDGSAYCMDARGVPQAVAQPVAFHHNAQASQLPTAARDTSISDSLTVSQQAAVALAFKVRGGVEVDSAGKAAGKGFLGSEETAFTLAATQDQWIGQPVATFAKTHKPMSATDAEGWSPVDAAPTVTHWPRDRSDAGTDVAVVQPVAFPLDTQNMTEGHASGGLGFGQESDPSFTLTKGHSHAVAEVKQVQWASGGGQVENDTAQALRAGAEYNYQFARVAMQVRRLTPVECSRLQGFPDTYLELTYGTESEAHASQVLHELWKQTGAIAREGWRPGIVASLFTPEVLLAGVHGGWISWEMATCCAIAPRPLSSKVNYAERFVRRLQEAGQDGRSPYQRESFRQLSEELGCSLSQLPLEEAQARKVLLNSELWPQAQAQWPLRYALATEKQRSSGKLNADGPRYKALGNSMAVPCMRWIGERIQAAIARQESP